MEIEAVIFDLDDTLLDTSELAELREQRRWNQIFRKMGLAKAFTVDGQTIAVEALPRAIADRGIATGILTNSPQPYAEGLLAKFGIKVGAMITGSDGYAPKPDPSGLIAVATELGVNCGCCVYVGDRVGDFGAAALAGMRSVGVAWDGVFPLEWRRAWPDVAVCTPDKLLAFVDGDDGLRPLAEVLGDGGDPTVHYGSLLRLGDGSYGLGRYFSSGDRRHPAHVVSELILKAKEDPEAAELVAYVFEVLATEATAHPPEMVMSVPPSPDGDYDRFAPTRARLAEKWDAQDGDGMLRMKFAVDGYKGMGHDQRRDANRGRFEADELDGETIVLIDDVLTSGGQSDACRETLLDAGAGHVVVVALGVSQEPLPLSCPRCDGILRVRTNGSTGARFWGCSNYPRVCQYTRSFTAKELGN